MPMPPEAARKPVVLTLISAYTPGNGASGPNISVRSMVAALNDEFVFLRVSLDRPTGQRTALAASGRWLDGPAETVRYCSPSPVRLGARGLADVLRSTQYDLLLLNGFHDREFTIPALLMRKLGLTPARPTIVSPRGEFSRAARGLKPSRKSAYRFLARHLRLFDDVWLHATSAAELEDIQRGFPYAKGYLVAPNVRQAAARPMHVAATDGVCRLLFLGRISRVKNLDLALRALARVRAEVAFDIYGPREDGAYWAECEQLIAALPPNVRTRYAGQIDNEAVPAALANYDLLFLPSRSENFGHAIFEALSCGVPVLIGDATPWRRLDDDDAGWDLPLGDPRVFAQKIDAFATMDAHARARLRAGARTRAERWVGDSDAVEHTRRMFRAALEGSRVSKPSGLHDSYATSRR
jgi:glycosyltransferase involved in cell wall biosynthesis